MQFRLRRKPRMIAIAQIDALIFDGSFCRAIRLNGEVLHVTGVRALRVLKTVFLHIRIEMATGGGEFLALRTLRSGECAQRFRPGQDP